MNLALLASGTTRMAALIVVCATDSVYSILAQFYAVVFPAFRMDEKPLIRRTYGAADRFIECVRAHVKNMPYALLLNQHRSGDSLSHTLGYKYTYFKHNINNNKSVRRCAEVVSRIAVHGARERSAGLCS